MAEEDPQKDTTNNNHTNSLDIDELASDYQPTSREQRGLLLSIFITSGFITGPIFLLIDLLFPRAFKFEFIDPTFLFLGISLSFLIGAIYNAWRDSTRYE